MVGGECGAIDERHTAGSPGLAGRFGDEDRHRPSPPVPALPRKIVKTEKEHLERWELGCRVRVLGQKHDSMQDVIRWCRRTCVDTMAVDHRIAQQPAVHRNH